MGVIIIDANHTDQFLCVFIPHLSLKISGSAALQGSQLTLRLAIACAFQDIWVALVQHLLQQPIRHALTFGCLSSWRCHERRHARDPKR
jgi:hypothetical protein